jgi:cysteinyl-tRNA synthetase
MTMFPITLYNTLTRQKEILADQDSVGMYVCGPTVYNRPHLGNARSVVVYDVLFRLLRACYGEELVTYVRNITDVDDKINAAARERGITIQALTTEVTAQFHADMAALKCLPPTIEPRATEHIAQMIAIIERLLAGGYAYESEGHVLFDVTSPPHNDWHYGMLSGRKAQDQEVGARVAVEAYKRNGGDFVLWKPADADDDASSVFESPWGRGRPGWHIECSAMSTTYLGTDFAIHGGGADLMFPHHENEIAQSCCAYPHSQYAKLWVHNGFLTVNGEKMSKSLGNFTTVFDVLSEGVRGEVIRFALLSSHYAKPLDWTAKLLDDGRKQLEKLYRAMASAEQSDTPADAVMSALSEDLNVPKAIAALHQMPAEHLRASGALLGLLQDDPASWHITAKAPNVEVEGVDVAALVAARTAAKQAKNWAEADRIRATLMALGITLTDHPDGTTTWG